MTRVYYNDSDPHACAWLRNLIGAGELPPGVVDGRSVEEVAPDEVRGFGQYHWFCGIGGWPLALRLADWPADRPVWTASLPCQPFSTAGKRKGGEDPRHLWPVFLRLVRECRPATLLGEQVDSADGRRWLARVRSDLEALGYAVGCAALPACCVGAPHRRERLFWVADAQGRGNRVLAGDAQVLGLHTGADADGRGAADPLGNALGAGRQGRGPGLRGGPVNCAGGGPPAPTGDAGPVGDLQGQRFPQRPADACRGLGGVGAEGERLGPSLDGRLDPWSDYLVLPCRDGKCRRVGAEPGDEPLAHGVPAHLVRPGPTEETEEAPSRAGMIRGYGNAIVPQAAALFIRAFLEAEADLP